MGKQPVSKLRRGGRSLPWLPHVVGRYYSSPIGSGASATTGVIPIDILYAVPFIVPDTHIYDRIAVEVTTQDASEPNDARLGIYKDNGAHPGALVLDAGEIDLTGTGAKEITISQTLIPGWYWLVFVTESGVAILRTYSGSACLPWLGTVDPDGQTSGYSFWSVAFTYAALPDPFTGGGALGLGSATVQPPKVMLRA